MNAIVLIFAKFPEPGAVKTRLAQTEGPERAAEIYAAMTKDLVQRLRAGAESGRYRLQIYGTPAHKLGQLCYWLNDGKPPIVEGAVQPERDLDGRLEHAQHLGFGPLKGAPVLMIGTDCPDISPELIAQAVALAATNDLVIGPAHDGGYYLSAQRIQTPGLFLGIEYSSATTRAALAARARALGLTVDDTTLPVLRDVDTAEDLAALSDQTRQRFSVAY